MATSVVFSCPALGGNHGFPCCDAATDGLGKITFRTFQPATLIAPKLVHSTREEELPPDRRVSATWRGPENGRTMSLLILIILIVLLFGGGGGYWGYRRGYYGGGGHSIIWIIVVILILFVLFGHGGRI
jgi:hypothetical protein